LSGTKGCTIPVLDAGGMDDHLQGRPFSVHHGMKREAVHLLADVVTHCVVSTAPFSPI
jgi:hypothetical protein